MRILSIGNSFSQDAQRYLNRVAKYNGEDITSANLYIGGCSLETHCLNITGDKADYDFQFNGESTGVKVSIRQALENVSWDVVTLQQASNFSADFSTYLPYIEELANHVRKYCPLAKIYIHETWAYEDGSERLREIAKFETSKEMYSFIETAYQKAREQINADGIIPCGRAMLKASELGLKVHRDTFHASFGAGRYLLALTWLKTFTGKDISNDVYNDFDEEVTQKERDIVIEAVNFATK